MPLLCIFDEELNAVLHFSPWRLVFSKRVCSSSRKATAIAASSSQSLRYVSRRRATNKQDLLCEKTWRLCEKWKPVFNSSSKIHKESHIFVRVIFMLSSSGNSSRNISYITNDTQTTHTSSLHKQLTWQSLNHSIVLTWWRGSRSITLSFRFHAYFYLFIFFNIILGTIFKVLHSIWLGSRLLLPVCLLKILTWFQVP